MLLDIVSIIYLCESIGASGMLYQNMAIEFIIVADEWILDLGINMASWINLKSQLLLGRTSSIFGLFLTNR